MSITYRLYEEDNDYSFFHDCVVSSPEWQEEECTINNLEEYMSSYRHIDGMWLIWLKENKRIGISFSVDVAPSNKRPWLGTLLVHHEQRQKGYGKSIVNAILDRWYTQGEKIAYTATPITQNGWNAFLSSCGFEQYKIEKEQERMYLLFIKPLN